MIVQLNALRRRQRDDAPGRERGCLGRRGEAANGRQVPCARVGGDRLGGEQITALAGNQHNIEPAGNRMPGPLERIAKGNRLIAGGDQQADATGGDEHGQRVLTGPQQGHPRRPEIVRPDHADGGEGDRNRQEQRAAEPGRFTPRQSARLGNHSASSRVGS